MKRSLVALLAASSLAAGSAFAQMKDSPGGKDHEIVGRFQGSVLIDYGRQSHEQIAAPLGAVQSGKDGGNVVKEKLEAEGRLSHDARTGHPPSGPRSRSSATTSRR